MMKYYKTLFYLLIIILIFQIIFVNSISARNYILQTETSQEIKSDFNTIILKPLDKIILPLTIEYTYGRFARPEGFPFPNQIKPIKLNFSILEFPDWCIVSNDIGSFEIPIKTFIFKKNETSTNVINLTIQIINTNIPAFKTGVIKCKTATSENGNIKTSTKFLNLTVEVDKIPKLEFNIPSKFDLYYGNEKTIDLYVKNIGNLNLTVIISNNKENNDLDIKFNNSITLAINEEKRIPIVLTNSRNEKINKTVVENFQIIGNAANYNNLTNLITQEFNLNITLKKQTTNIEDNENSLLPILIYISFILIISPMVITYILYKRKK